MNFINIYLFLLYMIKKTPNITVSPDVNKLQAVVIDLRTTIYVSLDTDPVEAKKRYIAKHKAKIG